MSSKGKGIAGKDLSGKRKRGNNDKVGNGSQRKRNREILQFFEDSAAEFDAESSDYSDEFDDLEDFINDIEMEPTIKSEPGKSESIRVLPKEEELSGDELEKMLQERYGNGSKYVKHAEDDYDSKRSVDRGLHLRSVAEPTIWKVKCKVGRERHTVFCLMQKYVDLKELGTKLQIISAFVVEHIKGFAFVEAEKQSDVVEACNQLADVYSTWVIRVPINEISQLLVVRRRYNEPKEGQWARVKSGIYKGDIAQVVAVNNQRKRATIKLIPRVDIQVLAGKYGGGACVKKSKSLPPARLISARELEEFRPLIQYRRDRDTGKVFEFLDNLMLKDGFLYKKISYDSLSFWDVNPSEDELHKFAPPSVDASDNLEWLSQLYGDQKKDSSVKLTKGGEKGAGTSGSNELSRFEVHDLVLFGKRDFGMIVGIEKDDSYKILKNGAGGPLINNMGHKDLKYVPLDRKFTALDHRRKTISMGDLVRIIDGLSKGRQGIVKQIYRGVIFLYDEHDFDNAYFCASSLMSEKVKPCDSASQGKDGGAPSICEDVPSSPKSPLSPKKPWQMRENNSDDRKNNDDMFSVGQSLRIRVGPLKGYLCRVLAIRRSEVTVKLDSQTKVLTVKPEHLAEVHAKVSGTLPSDDTGLSSAFKPFDLLGTEGCSNDWLQGSTSSTGGDGWNVGTLSSERSAWPAFPSSGASLLAGPSATDSAKEDDATLSKGENKNSTWGAAAAEKAIGDNGTSGAWGKSEGDWASANIASGNNGGGWKSGASNVDQEKEGTLGQANAWDKGNKIEETNSWTKQSSQEGHLDSWKKGKGVEDSGDWKVNAACDRAGSSGWGQLKDLNETSKWGQIKDNSGGNQSSAMDKSDFVKDSCAKTVTWGNENSSDEKTGWKGSGAASESRAGGWGEAKGEDSGGRKNSGWNNSSNEDRGKPEDAGGWGSGKVTRESGSSWNKSGDESSEWKSSEAASKPQTGSWGQVQGENASGEWKNNNWNGSSKGNWGKQENTSDWGKVESSSQGGSSWNKSNNTENDKGYGGRGFRGRRGRDGDRGGRSQFGRGRGQSFGQSGWSKENQADNDQGSGGRGFRGRRGRGGYNGGRDQFGRGRGSSFGQGQFSSWSKENPANSSRGGSEDQGSGWGNRKDWSSDSGTEGKPRGPHETSVSGSVKGLGGGDQSSWGHASGGSGDQDSGWGNRKVWSNDSGTKANVTEPNETSSWSLAKDTSGGGDSELNKVGSNKNSSWGASTNVRDDGIGNQGGGWGANDGGFGKSSGSGSFTSWKGGWEKSSGSGSQGGGWGADDGVLGKSPGGGSSSRVKGGWEKSSGSGSQGGGWGADDGVLGKNPGGGSFSSWKGTDGDEKPEGFSKGGGSNVGKEGAAGQAELWNDAEKNNNWGRQSGLDSWNKRKGAGWE